MIFYIMLISDILLFLTLQLYKGVLLLHQIIPFSSVSDGLTPDCQF